MRRGVRSLVQRDHKGAHLRYVGSWVIGELKMNGDSPRIPGEARTLTASRERCRSSMFGSEVFAEQLPSSKGIQTLIVQRLQMNIRRTATYEYLFNPLSSPTRSRRHVVQRGIPQATPSSRTRGRIPYSLGSTGVPSPNSTLCAQPSAVRPTEPSRGGSPQLRRENADCMEHESILTRGTK